MFPNKFYIILLMLMLSLGMELTNIDAEILENITVSSPPTIPKTDLPGYSSPYPAIKSLFSTSSEKLDTNLKFSTDYNEIETDRIINNIGGGDSSVAIGVGSVSKRKDNYSSDGILIDNSNYNYHNNNNDNNNNNNNNNNKNNNRNRMRMTLNLIKPHITNEPTSVPEMILSHSSSFPKHSSYPTVVTLPSISSLSSLTSSSTTSKSLKQKKSTMDTNVTVQLGNNAYLPCNVEQLIDKPVSWIRVRDGHILTVDHTQFIADDRFQPIYQELHQRWSLQIKFSQKHDMGLYECQVSTEPKRSSRVFLHVVVPKTELIGDHNRFVKAGSKVALHCIVRGSIEPPSYIIWFKGNQQIMQGNKQGWYMQIDREIFGNSSDQQNTIGSLIIPSVTKRDSGNYTCSPSNSAAVSVDLHVLNGEYSASAIMSSGVKNRQHFTILFGFIMIVLTVFKLS